MRASGDTWLKPGTVEQLRQITVDDIRNTTEGNGLPRYPEESFDKAILVCIESTTAEFTVACREYDIRLQELTPVRRMSTPDARGVAALAAQLVRDSFRPCLTFVRGYRDENGNDFVEVQAQAGELPPPDPSARQIREGDILRLFTRYMDKRTPDIVHEIRPLPLNYIRVLSVDDNVSRGLATGILMSHSAVSPFGRRGRQVQHLALRQNPSAPSSTLRLVNRGQDNRPMPCQRVNMVFKLRPTDDDQAAQVPLLSDRKGTVTIPVQEDFPTVWLYVYSGSKLLARVPYAPGLLPQDTIELPDDTIRLDVEGDLQVFQNDLIDAVAMREVHFSLAKKAAKEKRADDLEQHLRDYLETPSRREFMNSLTTIRIAAQQRADAAGNRRARIEVDNMCRSVERSLEHFFSDYRREQRQEEIEELREKARD